MDPVLRRSALSVLLPGFAGPVAPHWLLDALADGLGGVVLFATNLTTDPGGLIDTLRRAAGRDIVIALDEEGGEVTRLDAATGSASPGAAALGFLDRPDITRSVHRTIGRRLAELGVTTDLAPVADVNTEAGNPVIGLRSFGSDPDLVSRHVAAAVEGLQDTGVAACLKHFPGHGATRVDSHERVATVAATAEELDATELVPFRAGIDAGARAVMTGHLLVPALDPHHLATVSAVVTTNLLRDRLGFTGTVLTDALEMGALDGTVGLLDGAVAALVAGADGVESGSRERPGLVTDFPLAVATALEEGRLTEDRLADAGERVARLALPPPVPPDEVVPGPRFDVEIVGDLPLLRNPTVLECRPAGSEVTADLGWSLARPLDRLRPGLASRHVHDPADVPPGTDAVVVVRDPHRHPWQRAVVERAAAQGAVIVVDVGWPAVEGYPTVRTRGVAPGLLTRAAQLVADHVEV